MHDFRTHGLLTPKPPAQTYCGLSAEGLKTTTDPFRVTCGECNRLMEITDERPTKDNMIPRGPGRPAGPKKGGFFR